MAARLPGARPVHSHAFGPPLDVEADRAAGRRPAAGLSGVVAATWRLAALRVTELVSVWPLDPVVATSLGASASRFCLDAAVGSRERADPASLVVAFFFLPGTASQR